MLIELWIRLLTRKGTQVPVVEGVLEAVEKNSLDLHWTALASRFSPGYRLRIGGEHYFILSSELDLLPGSDKSTSSLLRIEERIVLAYRNQPPGRRTIAWAFQPRVSLNPWGGDPRETLRAVLWWLVAGVTLLGFGCGALYLDVSGRSDSAWIVLPGIASTFASALLLGLALFGLWDLRSKDRFVYFRARREAMVSSPDVAKDSSDAL